MENHIVHWIDDNQKPRHFFSDDAKYRWEFVSEFDPEDVHALYWLAPGVWVCEDVRLVYVGEDLVPGGHDYRNFSRQLSPEQAIEWLIQHHPFYSMEDYPPELVAELRQYDFLSRMPAQAAETTPARQGNPDNLVRQALGKTPNATIEDVARETRLSKKCIRETQAWKDRDNAVVKRFIDEHPGSSIHAVHKGTGFSVRKINHMSAWYEEQKRRQERQRRERQKKREARKKWLQSREYAVWQIALESAGPGHRGPLQCLKQPQRDELIRDLGGIVGEKNWGQLSTEELERIRTFIVGWIAQRELDRGVQNGRSA